MRVHETVPLSSWKSMQTSPIFFSREGMAMLRDSQEQTWQSFFQPKFVTSSPKEGTMSFDLLAVGILALVIGSALCFAGYRAFRALIAVWGFFAGFLLMVQAVGVYSGDHFLVSVGGLVIAFIVGLVLAALAYYLYVAAVVILSASVGFWVGTGLMMALGYSSHSTPALLTGVIFAGIMAIPILALNLTKI